MSGFPFGRSLVVPCSVPSLGALVCLQRHPVLSFSLVRLGSLNSAHDLGSEQSKFTQMAKLGLQSEYLEWVVAAGPGPGGVVICGTQERGLD